MNRGLLKAALFCALLTALILAPVIVSDGPAAIGAEQGDLLDSIWGYWWFASDLSVSNPFPQRVDSLYYPTGGKLVIPDPFNAYLAGLFGAAWRPVFSYNLIIAVHLFLAGFGAFILARRFGADSISGMTVSALLITHSHLLSLIEEGVPSATGIGFIALALALLDSALSKQRRRSSILPASFCTAIATLCGHYHGAQLLFLSVWLLGHRLSTSRDHRFIIFRFASVYLLFFIFVVPFQIPYLNAVRGGDELRIKSRLWNPQEPFDSTGLEFFVPLLQTPAPIRRPSYLGILLMILVICAVGSRKKNSHWLVPGALLLMLSFGARWHWLLKPFLDVSPILERLAQVVPLTFLRNPFRFQAGALIALLPVAASGAQWIRMRLGSKVAYGLCLLAVMDNLALSGAPFPVASTKLEIPDFYQSIARDQTCRALLDLPVRFRFDSVGWYEFLQTVHKKAIPYNISEVNDITGLHATILDLELVKEINKLDPWFASIPKTARYRLEEEILAASAQLVSSSNESALSESVRRLHDLGYGYVVLHTQRLDTATAESMANLLDRWLIRINENPSPLFYKIN